MNKNIVYIARSLDGYIADKNGGLDWLDHVPGINDIDTGYAALIQEIDALVMGRNTFEVVRNFGVPWPYDKHVFVLSTTLSTVPAELTDKITFLKGTIPDILKMIHDQGYHTLYIDGGKTIQNFLKVDLIDELRITTIPLLLGGGFPLFGELTLPLAFTHVKSEVFLGEIVQDWYLRGRLI